MEKHIAQRASELFSMSLDIPAARRRDFLTAACGHNPALLLETISLLDAHEKEDACGRIVRPSIGGLSNECWKRDGPLLSQGQTVRDDYTVERLIGEGAFAEVYLVEHRIFGRLAMKVMKSAATVLSDLRDRLSEAVLLSKISHPNIVRVFDASTVDCDDGPHAFFTMEYFPYGTLDRHWKSYRSEFMPVPEVVEIVRQLCSGIAVAHSASRPIVHRDIKPHNVLVRHDAGGLRVRVSDFGLAKSANPMTMLLSAQGTVGFKPPEFLKGEDSPQGDVWAIGTTMYLLLTDKLPYGPISADTAMNERYFDTPLRPPSFYNIRVEPYPLLDAIVARCLSRVPQDRFSNAMELGAELAKWQPAAPPTVPIPRNRRSGVHTSKTELGAETPAPASQVSALLKESLSLARNPNTLSLAADKLEEAMGRDGAIREQYHNRLNLWRRGLSG